ncbi:MAG: FecR family protein [Bacteroidetes bacterium]|nr:FecR family protein [Bacteroidota bacterium]MBL6943112.1 FecR family protein [Bacteroidales bacterium]
MRYKDYQFNDFVLDDSFINFATNKNQQDVGKWEKWLSNNPKNKETALEAKMLVSQLRFKRQELSSDFVAGEWLKLSNNLSLPEIKPQVKSRPIFKRKIWQYAVAASLILFFTSAIYYFSSTPKCEEVASYHEIIVPKGDINSSILPDGTLVSINSDSKLKYTNCFGEENREVFLEGEAYFEVTHNAKMPFVVHTQENVITVLGTTFNVYAYPNENIFMTSLERGKISVSRHDKEIVELKVNQTYLLKKDCNKSEITEISNIQSYSSWKEGKIVFRNQQFTEILRKLERSHNVIFDLQKNEVEDIKYTGTFTSEDDITTILGVIMLTTPFEYEILKDTIIIK